MWRFKDEDRTLIARAVRGSGVLSAHLAYFNGDLEAATRGYSDTIERFLPKVERAERRSPARVVLGFCSRLALYAGRAKADDVSSMLWERWGLAYLPDALERDAAGRLCVLAALTGQASSAGGRRAALNLRLDDVERICIEGLLDADARSRALETLRGHFEDYSGDGEALRPWDDEPLIGCYELLHRANASDWRSVTYR